MHNTQSTLEEDTSSYGVRHSDTCKAQVDGHIGTVQKGEEGGLRNEKLTGLKRVLWCVHESWRVLRVLVRDVEEWEAAQVRIVGA